jgi:hypothetical protein
VTRTFVMGDPQAPFSKVLEVLDHHHALADDKLAPDVVLVSIGDHFDFDHRNPHPASIEGLTILRWLASHDPAQVILLFGNHDAARVMEFATISDDDFARARQLALVADAAEHTGGDVEAALAAYRASFPELPPHGVVGRDYAAFTSEQRALVMELLLAGRFHLATTGNLPDGRDVLVTHAGVTQRELALLGLAGARARDPAAIANALEAHLAACLGHVRDDWQRGQLAPLSLAPLHVTGGCGHEGGGLLYHRPSNPAQGDKAWSLDPSRPRRFDPRTLPCGLTQIAGHSGHAKCVHELGPWATQRAKARKHGGIRTLRVAGDQITYDLGVASPAADVADLILIDGELRRVPAVDVALLELAK